MTVLTPETRAELRAKAVAARDAQAAYIAMCERGEGLGSAWDARDAAQGDLEDALTPDRVIALLDSSEPVAGGEFEAKLRKLIVDYACLGPATIEELERALDAHDSAFVAVVAAYARLQAERDKLSADLGEHVRLREKAEHRVEVAKEANALLTAERDAAVAEVGRLREALQFYAAPTAYMSELRFLACGCRDSGAWSKTPVLVDDGERARAALAGPTP